MIRIRLAKTAGFCMGVRRAVDMVLDLQRDSPPLPIMTYGPLIHNPQTLDLLRSRGILQANSLDDVIGGTVVIRAHGISPNEQRILREKGVRIIDATCPRVSRVQAVIRKHASMGYFCVIVGDEDHPEVRGLMGFASAGGIVIPSADCPQLATVNPEQPICAVAQTTQEIETFNQVIDKLGQHCGNLRVYNTICDSTRRRQAEVAKIANNADVIVVVGGRGSGNTQRLVKVAESQGVPALHVETAEEIKSESVANAKVIGVTAGASTPNWQIRLVTDKIKEIGLSKTFGLWMRVRRLADIAVMTYCWAAMAGGALTACSLVLQRQKLTWMPLMVTALFVFSMHLLNRIQERAGAVRFNTPEIAQFYAKHRKLLTALGALSSLAAVILCYRVGLTACALLTAMLIMGRLYTVPLISWKKVRWRSLKDFPGSKTPLVAIGWAVSAAILPVADNHLGPASLAAFTIGAGMVFWRTALSDLLDIQGDRIVGRETIPILMGVKNTRRLLMILLFFLGIVVFFSTAAGIVPPAGNVLLINIAVFAGIFVVFKKRHLVDRLWLEGIMDGNFLAAGLLMVFYGGN